MLKPPRKHEWKDQYTLLCESCGYILEGLNQSLPCPECGKPIEESLPGARKGTPYQQHPSFKSTFRTAITTIHNPKQVVAEMSYHQSPPVTPIARYLTYSVVACTVLLVLPLMTRSLFSSPSDPQADADFGIFLSVLIAFGMLVFLGLAIWAIFAVITMAMTVCITILMKLLRTRGDMNVGWVIAGHASIGWLFTGIIWVSGFHILPLIRFLVPTHSDWEKRVQMGILIKNVLEPTFLLGLLIGTLVFTYISYLGIKQSRYLNLPQSTPESVLPNEPRP